MGKALETVNTFYHITETRKGDGLEAILADDMTFVGPLMKTSGAKDYIDTTRQFLQMHMATRMLKQFENGSEVCSIYEMDVATPVGGKITLELTDWIHTLNGKVTSQRIYYDPRKFAEAFGIG